MDDFKQFNSKWTGEQIQVSLKVLSESFTVQEACERLGVSPDALRSAFSNKGLKSPSEYLRKLFDPSEDPLKKDGYKTHLVIPDSHAKPGVSNDRYEWLGKLVCERMPDVIINIGDWADMESLSSYDKGKKSFEGRRYKKDIEAANDALKRFHAPIFELNEKREAAGLPRYEPRLVTTLGNHDEARIKRAINASPELDGILSVDDIKFAEFGWEVYPFLEVVMIDGIAYSHYFPSGIMGKPIGGENAANMLIKKQLMSCTAGHSHVRDYSERTRADGKRIQGLTVGCYFEHREDYAGPANDMWWRGVVIKNYVKDGQYEPEFISLEVMKKLYG